MDDQFRLAIDKIPGLVWSSLPDGYVDFLNQRWCDYTGLSMDEAMGWGWQVAVCAEDLPSLVDTWKTVLSSGEPGEAVARLRRFDGTLRWFLFRAMPVRDEAGVVVKWYGETTDIEDQKRAEALLAGEKRLLEMIAKGEALHPTLDALCRLVDDNADGGHCAIRLVDSAGRRVQHGAAPALPPNDRPEQVIVSDIASDARLKDSEWAELALAQGWRACWTQPIMSLEGRVLGTFGLYAETSGEPTPQQRNLIEQCCHIASIAVERMHSEDTLHQVRAELAHVSRAASLGALTASIAHEINQPLSGIVTNASTCVRLLDSDPPNIDGARETARRTIRDANRAADVIARLRALFRKKSVTTESLDVNQAIREVVALLRRDIEASHVSLRTELSARLRPIAGDRVQIQQVVVNLVLNALDAMSTSRDGARRLFIKTEPAGGDHVRVVVEDSGVGVDPADAERIFDPFYTSKHDGMGMGLSISRSIIESHGGRLWAEANRDNGATFAFTLPTSVAVTATGPDDPRVPANA
ncbi:MAG: tmoS 1 [Candidatus Eremiobacteraeota bacterium]|nr:tmoS 1 [Candidatus Eremiobacteraeota bacterium]